MADHVVVRDGGATLECLACGDVARVVLPMRVETYLAMTEAFARSHEKCDSEEEEDDDDDD